MIELVWLHGTFVGLADAIRLKGLVDAYTNRVFVSSAFWETLVMPAATVLLTWL